MLNNPTEDEEAVQVARIRAFLGKNTLMALLLEYLVRKKRGGLYNTHPSAADVLFPFYVERATLEKRPIPDIDSSEQVQQVYQKGRRLVSDLRNGIDRYYNGPGKSDLVVITVPSGEDKTAHAPEINYRDVDHTKERSAFSPDHPEMSPMPRTGLTIIPKWESDPVKDLMRRASHGSELRLQTTYFLNTGRMIETFSKALGNGANVRVLLTDPNSPLLRARFRLRRDGQSVDNIKHLIRSQLHDLHLLRENNPGAKLGASLEFEVTDIMPFGFFVQGKSEKDGDWMRIGLMPATVTYMDGPMISITPDAAELWDVLENTWGQTWATPRDPLRRKTRKDS